MLQETKPKNTENIKNLLFFIKVLLVFLFIVIYTKDEKLTFTKRRTFSTKCKTTLLKVMTLLKNYSFKNTFEIKYTNISRRGLSTQFKQSGQVRMAQEIRIITSQYIRNMEQHFNCNGWFQHQLSGKQELVKRYKDILHTFSLQQHGPKQPGKVNQQ